MDHPEIDLDGISDVAHLASPLTLGQRVLPNFRARAHQKVISDAYMDAVTGNGPRFICVSIGQQLGKSQVTSVLCPAHWLELHTLGLVPGGLVGLMSYEDSLAMSWSVKVRRMIESNPDVFYSTLRKDTKAAGYWETNQGGGILAIGIGGAIQGRSISLLGIDDPTKSLEQALSPGHQIKLWDHWTSVIIGRLQPWTVVLVTMVRYCPDDFVGRLTSSEYEGDPDAWKYIRIPYVSDSEDDVLGRPIGEPLLRPQSDQTIEQAKEEAEFIRVNSSDYAFATLWQQDPRSPDGVIFAEENWRYYGGDSQEILPKEFDVVLMSWDMAFKDQKHHDWVVGQAWGAREADRFLLDQVRGHWGFTETRERVTNFAKEIRRRYPKAQLILVEDKANGPAIIDQLRSKVGGLVEFPPKDSKLARAWAIQPLQRGGNLYLPAPSVRPWVKDFTRECEVFRGDDSGHDDQVDAMSQALIYLMDYSNEPSFIMSPEHLESGMLDGAFSSSRRGGIFSS